MQHLTDIQTEQPIESHLSECNPAYGKNVLFFSGGSALHSLCEPLLQYTHQSTHLVTPFDSGGSSAELRKAFKMPAIGDVRARLLSLIDPAQTNKSAISELFNFRLVPSASEQAKAILDSLAAKQHTLLQGISSALVTLISRNITAFMQAVPNKFNYTNAALGNLILVGGFLYHNRQLEPALFELSDAMEVKGKVRLTVTDHFHLSAKLKNGQRLIGQHIITGKTHPAISSPIEDIALSKSVKCHTPAQSHVSDFNQQLIERADLICFPPGSFYSSVIANLLPTGIVAAIAKNPNPKVYVPSLGHDPEMLGLSTMQSIIELANRLTPHHTESTALTHVLMDQATFERQQNTTDASVHLASATQYGVKIICADLTSARFSPYYDPHKLCKALMSLTL